ncbi:Ctdspl2 [Symbiodinium natans]|uniref:Ctdspl2 protein n=1 Tax=Symbiodinium natans TaxID=878477 RepID=A0A812TSH1_9DINO|nr:Ctdspl2 [Symbiodinium natans]
MVSQLPRRPVIVSPAPTLNFPANMGQNYSVMGSGPMIPTYFTTDFTGSSGACPNPNLLMPKAPDTSQYVKAPDTSQYVVQAPYVRPPYSPTNQASYVRPPYSPTNQPAQVAYLQHPGTMPVPGTSSPMRSVSADQMRLTLPLSSRVTGPGMQVPPGPPSPPRQNHSPMSTQLRPQLLAGAKETAEAAAAHCALSEEVRLFLADMGFVYYQEAFRRGGFEDMDTVMAMSQDDMRGLGMLPGHVLKMDMKLDELCKSQGKVRRGKVRLPIGGMPFPWPMQMHTASPTAAAISPTAAAAACLGMSGMMSRSAVISNAGSASQPILAPSPKALVAPKAQLALSPIGSRTPSPVDKDIAKFNLGAGWTDGRETGVTTVDEESDSRSMSEVDGEERTSSAPPGSSEPNPSSGSPTSTATFTPHPMRAHSSFNTIGTLGSGMVALPPGSAFGSNCTGLSVRTNCSSSGRFGAGTRKMKRDELEEMNARKQANKKVFAWLQQNRFSNVNHERWFLGRGFYPLHAAIRENNVEMVKLLLDLKADPAKKNSGGQTPLEYAQIKQRTSVITDMLQGDW